VLAVTLVLWWAVSAFWGVLSLAEGQVFTDYESFAAFMEQDVRDGYSGSIAETVPVDSIMGGMEDIPRETLYDRAGNVLVTYVPRNESVAMIDYADTDSRLPITVYTYADLRAARNVVAVRNVCFGFACILEAGAAVAFYLTKRKKMA